MAVPGWGDPVSLALIREARVHRLPLELMAESTARHEPRVAWKEALKRRIVRLSDAALVGGRPQADYVVQLGMPRERIFLGYDVVDNDHFSRPAPAPPEIGPWNGRPFFLASARFIAKTNLPRLLRAFARYRELAGFEAWNLVLLAGGPLRAELQALRAQLGLEPHLLMPGFRQYPELPGWYQAASGFVHASTSEQWGLVVNEAMAAGLPVLVSSRCGCAVDLVQGGGPRAGRCERLHVRSTRRGATRPAHAPGRPRRDRPGRHGGSGPADHRRLGPRALRRGPEGCARLCTGAAASADLRPGPNAALDARPPMKAALVMAHLSRAAGGLAHSVPGLARALADHGVRANILGVRDPLAPEEAASWGSGVHACSSRGPRLMGWSPELARTLARLDPDVADTQHLWMFPSLAVVRWSKQHRKPYIVTQRGMLDPRAVRRSAWKKRIVRLWLEDAHLKSAACLRALNEAEARAIRAFGLSNPIAVVPYGVDLPPLDPDRAVGDPPTLLFLGRIDTKKGVHELVRGWARLGLARGEWRLRLVGWGPSAYVEATRRLIDELGLGGSVELPGPLFGTEKDEAFRAADAFILPSYSEGLPVVVLEAWSYALPVLMTPACNVPEGFAAGAALEIDTEPESIAEGVRALVEMSEAERRAMGARGHCLVEERFTWPGVAAAMAEVYRWVAGGGPRPDCVATS